MNFGVSSEGLPEGYMNTFTDLLKASQARHSHLCPRQVLGIRIALMGLELLEIDSTQKRPKRLLVISETDGCFVDGIEVTARVSVGHRSLNIKDYGKIAATFINLKTNQAVRLHPAPKVRELAKSYLPLEKRAYFAQLEAYQVIPDHELLSIEWVTLHQPIRQIMGTPRQRACCMRCGEEIINGREITINELTLCAACAGQAYYHVETDAAKIENKREQINAFLPPP